MNKPYKCTVISKRASIDDTIIEAFQIRMGTTLPDEYRQFLLLHNGGIPNPQQVDVPSTNNSVLVDYLYGILPNRIMNDIEYETERMSDYVHSGHIVIGHDPGGNAYLLATNGEECGRVYFWDKRGLLTKKRGGNTFWLADSITVLLNSLYDAETV